ncbi:hypothetical protein [Streptomyces mirabilis]|uniref:hypothetical protein n=1 Tax=Streptomyces mirabilis TaxID=68239 RepID=UPI0033CC1EDC
MARIESLTLPTSSVELDTGENLRDLAVGDSLQLQPDTGFGGLWIAARFDDNHSHLTLYNAKITTSCGNNPAIACSFHGARHAHPVALDGRLLRRPAVALASR